MKNNKSNDNFNEDETFDETLYYFKRPAKVSRSKDKYQARKKVEAYLERKSMRELFDDYDYSVWDEDESMDNSIESDVRNYMNEYSDEQDWVDYAQVDGQDYRF